MSLDKISESLKTWMEWCSQEQLAMSCLSVSYMPDKNSSYREGYIDALVSSEAHMGLLMMGAGVDLRDSKPPVGLTPKNIHKSARMKEIMNAITRYTNSGNPIPKEWIDELQELILS